MARKHDRTKARRCAIQVLYTSSIRDIDVGKLIEESMLDCLEAPLSDYALKLLDGVEENKASLDDKLSAHSENWSIERMPVMDLNILRVALFEMLYVDDVPISVSINEAVELAKDFGGDDNSPKFINGMLGNIARKMGLGADTCQADANCIEAVDPGSDTEGAVFDVQERTEDQPLESGVVDE